MDASLALLRSAEQMRSSAALAFHARWIDFSKSDYVESPSDIAVLEQAHTLLVNRSRGNIFGCGRRRFSSF